MSERSEAFMRILVAIISGIILGIWKTLVLVVSILHWFVVVFTGKRNGGMAEFSNAWATQAYRFIRYMAFTTNERPFPFTSAGNVKDPVVMKK